MIYADRCEKIELILSDVDGVLTDGGVIYDNSGNESKRFHIRDGLGIKLWQRAGKTFGIVTGRKSQIVDVRAQELGVSLVHQGVEEKLPIVMQIAAERQLTLEQICYIGDDLPDMPVFQKVGLGIAVADAADDVRASAHYTTALGGGTGAVREVIELILRTQKRWSELLAKYSNHSGSSA
jgi:YrbI family 3-deoxy-D-manno-octulosonate 8-phosphate phosphatase